MPFVEVFTPPGALTAEQREIIGQRLVAEVMRAEGAPDTAQAALGTSTQVASDALGV